MIFFGTHNLACTVLHELLESGFSFDAVVTQPDKPAGRGKQMQQPPIKRLAEKHKIEVLQYASLDKEALQKLASYNPELFVVVEYGLLIPQDALDIPRRGSLNVHPSILPQYRGATPIQSALLDGLTITGVTLMLLDAELDHGPIVAQKTSPIEPEDNYLTLEARLGRIGAQLLAQNIGPWIDGSITPAQQNHQDATFCSKLEKEDGQIDWNTLSTTIVNKHRAYFKWPGIFTYYKGNILKLTAVAEGPVTNLAPGTVFTEQEQLFIACKDSSVEVQRLARAGKKEMDALSFLRGSSALVGTKLPS